MAKEGRLVVKWWFLGLVLMVITAVVLIGLDAAGVIFHTDVERRVYEKSHQYREGLKQKIAVYEAQLAEINSRLSDPKLDPSTRNQLEAQRSMVRVQLRSARNIQPR